VHKVTEVVLIIVVIIINVQFILFGCIDLFLTFNLKV